MKYKLPKLEKKDKDTLKKNYSHLETSARHQYCLPIIQSEKIALWSIYEKYISSNSPNPSCPKCVLKVCTALYNLYEELK